MGSYEGGGEEGGWNCVDGERAGGGGEERKRPCSRTVRLAFAQAGPPSFFLSFFHLRGRAVQWVVESAVCEAARGAPPPSVIVGKRRRLDQ